MVPLFCFLEIKNPASFFFFLEEEDEEKHVFIDLGSLEVENAEKFKQTDRFYEFSKKNL